MRSRFYQITYFQAWDTFVFFGFYATLVLLSQRYLGLSYDRAYQAFGAYVGMIYAGPLIGGYLADRFLGSFNAIALGALMGTLGNVTLMLVSASVGFYFGLALTMLGTALLKSNTSACIAQLTKEDKKAKAVAFNIFYIGMNIGGFGGAVVYGVLGQTVSWTLQFGLNTLGMISTLIMVAFLAKSGLAQDIEKPDLSRWPIWKKASVVSVIMLALYGLNLCILQSHLALLVFLAFFVAGIGAMSFQMWRGTDVKGRRHFAYLLLACGVMVLFFAVEFQTSSSLVTLLEAGVSRAHLAVTIPYAWLMALLSLAVVVGAKVLNGVYRSLAQKPLKQHIVGRLAWCFALSALGYSVFLGAVFAIQVLAIGWAIGLAILGIILFGFAEMSAAPAVINAIDHLTPKGYSSRLMSFWCLTGSLGGFAAGWIASLTLVHDQINFLNYKVVYATILFVFVSLFGLAMFLGRDK